MVKAWLLHTFLICILFLVTIGCSKTIERDPPQTVSDALNEFVGSAPFQYINLDEMETQNILLNENDIIHNIIDGEAHIGQLTEFTQIADRFYIYDGIGNGIFEIHTDGTVNGSLTREGSGPGEHGIIWNLKSNNRYIYAVDVSNARTNLYTTKMDFVEQNNGLTNLVDLNDEFILTENRSSRGIAPIIPDQGRMVLRSLDNLADTLTTIMPRIIPAGYEPQMYNTTSASLNQRNEIAAGYYFLPWFFLFDEQFNHTQTLILEYSVFDEMDIPPMDFFKHLTNEGFGGNRPITEYKLMDNGDIFFTVRRELFHLTRSQNGTYQIAGKYRFDYSPEEESMWISDIFPSDNENEFIVGSWHHLFRFSLQNVE